MPAARSTSTAGTAENSSAGRRTNRGRRREEHRDEPDEIARRDADRGRERRAPATVAAAASASPAGTTEEVDVELMRVEARSGDAPPERDVFAEGGVRPDAEREPLAVVQTWAT